MRQPISLVVRIIWVDVQLAVNLSADRSNPLEFDISMGLELVSLWLCVRMYMCMTR
jgi:hypothetical protein